MATELEELGPLVGEGTTLLHLQCHFGLDTLSWARRGAHVVGLDLSDEAVALARRLAAETGLEDRAEFVCADVYEAGAHLGGRKFDVVFVSWGAIEWLPDLGRWADVVARHLKPGGTFYLAEIHPFAYGLDEVAGAHDVYVKYRLLPAPDRPDVEPVEGSYADRGADTQGLVSYGWPHSFAEIIGALTGAGLRLEHLHEFPTSPAPFWDWMVRDDERWWWLPAADGGLRATCPSATRCGPPARGPDGGGAMLDEFLKANLASWDESVAIHVASELYDVDGFRRGKSSLSALELEELGPLVGEGTTLLHLQCHFGLDTLSWARRGAVVTGVDFSGEGIATARALADDVGLTARATFLQSDVERLPEGCRVVRRGVHVLGRPHLAGRPRAVGGRGLPASSSPAASSTSPSSTPTRTCSAETPRRESLRVGYPYFQYGSPQRLDEEGDYADLTAEPRNTVTYEWNHGFAEIIDPLLRRGLRLGSCTSSRTPSPGCPSLPRALRGRPAARQGPPRGRPADFTLLMTKER